MSIAYNKIKIKIRKTWVSVSDNDDENSALSDMERYCFFRNLFSNATSCSLLNGVLGFRLGLCFRNGHFTAEKQNFSYDTHLVFLCEETVFLQITFRVFCDLILAKFNAVWLKS